MYGRSAIFNDMEYLLENKLQLILATVTLLFAFSGIFFTVSRHNDMNSLREIIRNDIKGEPGTGEFVEELTQWIYFNKGFAKNKQYYFWSKLGPTPGQIIDTGGDCADKSRLLAAMLKSVDMNSTLVMLYGYDNCDATHTVVEANYGNNLMAADPVYNMVFPKGNGQYWGIKDLRDKPFLLTGRLDQLKKEKGERNKIAFYKRDIETYSWIKTINWDSSVLTRLAGRIVAFFSAEPFLVRRPHFLEDPKLFISIIFFGFGAVTFASLIPITLV